MDRNEHLNCTDCALSEHRTQVVLPDFKPNVQIVAIGEAPGKDEDLSGFGFAGRAGKTLDTLFEEHGISRTEYGRANMCCCRPPDNRKPKRLEMERCERWLKWWLIEQIPTRVVLAVGGTPSNYFYQTKSLTDALSLAVERDYKPVIPWADVLRVVPCPHTSPLAFNRNAPSGIKWSCIAREQVKKTTEITLIYRLV